MLTPYWLSTTGGITTYVYNLVEELRKRSENRVVVITCDASPGVITAHGNNLVLVMKITKILRKIKPNVIHCHVHFILLMAAFLYRMLFNRGVGVIFTFHTQPPKILSLKNTKTKRKPWWRRKIINWELERCNVITCVSVALAEKLKSIGLPIRGFAITPPGVRKKDVLPGDATQFRKDYGLGGAFPIICTVGVLIFDFKVRGIEILIEVFAKIVAVYPDAKLLIIGDGPHRKRLERFAEQMGTQNSVIFTGNIENPFVTLSVSDIYCHVVLDEAMPIALLEAMISGKPVVTANVGGIPEIVTSGQDGILVEPNVEDVTEALFSLIRDRDMRKSLGTNAKISVAARFSWSETAGRFMELYRRSLNR